MSAPAVTITGHPGPFQRRITAAWKKGVGWQSVITFEGVTEALKAYVPTLQADADELEVDFEGPTGSVVARYNRDAVGNPNPTTVSTESETTWELGGNEVAKDIFEHPLTKPLTTDQIIALKAQILLFETGGNVNVSTLNTLQQTLFALITKGIRQYQDTQWTITKTRIVERNFIEKVSMAGINQRWTSTQIAAVPGFDKVVLFAISQIQAPTDIPAAFEWSWLKKSPHITRTSGGRFQMVESWWLDAWAKDLYTPYTG